MLILSEEVKDILVSKATLITFFGLPKEQQIQILPVLEEEKKYDFPDGDLITDDALEVLLNDYNASLNSIILRLDEPDNDTSQILFQVIEELFCVTNFLIDRYDDNIDNLTIFKLPEWSKLRELSSIVQKMLNIHSEVNINILRSCIEYWLHF
ncbi:MAG: hypothetical protein WBF90_14915 [Rivularia sp. (in: cyanobacteria)]